MKFDTAKVRPAGVYLRVVTLDVCDAQAMLMRDVVASIRVCT